MARRISESEFKEIEKIVGFHSGGVSAQDIAFALAAPLPLRTLQHRLRRLVEENRLEKEGERRWATYRIAPSGKSGKPVAPGFEGEGENVIPVSESSAGIRAYLQQPTESRNPVGYNHDFLASYLPNASAYLSSDEREHLAKIGAPGISGQPAGTYGSGSV